MQATVHRFDGLTGSGSVLTDDGVVLPFGPEVFAASGLRLLRVGQRLTVTVSENAGPRVVDLRLGTVGSAPPTLTSP